MTILRRQLSFPPHQISFLKVLVRLLEGLHSCHPHALYEAILCRPEIPLHAALGLRAVRRDPGDPISCNARPICVGGISTGCDFQASAINAGLGRYPSRRK